MIASALRTEIIRLTSRICDGNERGQLARCSGSLQRLVRGLTAAANEETLPSMRALVALFERSERDEPAECLAYRAFAEHLAAEIGLPSADRDRIEAALDSLDERVADPRQLAPVRRALTTFAEHFDRFCQEVSRAARRSADLAASAA